MMKYINKIVRFVPFVFGLLCVIYLVLPSIVLMAVVIILGCITMIDSIVKLKMNRINR